jgi:hypothetical protein
MPKEVFYICPIAINPLTYDFSSHYWKPGYVFFPKIVERLWVGAHSGTGSGSMIAGHFVGSRDSCKDSRFE